MTNITTCLPEEILEQMQIISEKMGVKPASLYKIAIYKYLEELKEKQ